MAPDSPPKSTTLLGDLGEIRRYSSLILLFASIPAIGLPGVVARLLHLDEVVSLWRLIAATAPLTAAVTVVGIARLSKGFDVGPMILITFSALLASLFLGLMLGQDLPIGDFKGLHPIAFIYEVLAAYFRYYGGWSFATSILVGGLLAWAWSRKLWPRISTVGRGPGEAGSPDPGPTAGEIHD